MSAVRKWDCSSGTCCLNKTTTNITTTSLRRHVNRYVMMLKTFQHL
ncbi:MAG: hypothetical protein ACTS6G_02180 [Candidatus Hodgkinia cicadicola]